MYKYLSIFSLDHFVCKMGYKWEPPTKANDGEVASEKDHLHSWKKFVVAFTQLLTLDKACKIAHNPKLGPLGGGA